MSILIKGMKMPDSCYHCKIAESCGHYIANYTDRRHPDCPIIALPDHHGRLVDADALFEAMEKSCWYNNADRDEIAEKLVMDAPTIEPQRKKGKWTGENACEFCGFQPWYERDIHTLSYCPNCGADMREDGEADEVD